jgi:transposase-like protein
LKKFTNCPKCDRFSGVAKIDKERHQCPECQTVWTYDIGEKIRCIDCDEKKEKTEVETEVETHIQTESFRCKGCNVTWEIPVGDQLECPRCDADVDNLVEELKKDLEQAETEGVVKSTENYNCKACNQTYWTIEDARRCCTDKENEWTHPDYKCDICGKVTQFPNTTHAKCLQEQASTTPII